MKHLKRTISLVLVLAMMLGMSVTVRADDSIEPVGEGHGTLTPCAPGYEGRFNVAGKDFYAVVHPAGPNAGSISATPDTTTQPKELLNKAHMPSKSNISAIF